MRKRTIETERERMSASKRTKATNSTRPYESYFTNYTAFATMATIPFLYTNTHVHTRHTIFLIVRLSVCIACIVIVVVAADVQYMCAPARVSVYVIVIYIYDSIYFCLSIIIVKWKNFKSVVSHAERKRIVPIISLSANAIRFIDDSVFFFFCNRLAIAIIHKPCAKRIAFGNNTKNLIPWFLQNIIVLNFFYDHVYDSIF